VKSVGCCEVDRGSYSLRHHMGIFSRHFSGLSGLSDSDGVGCRSFRRSGHHIRDTRAWSVAGMWTGAATSYGRCCLALVLGVGESRVIPPAARSSVSGTSKRARSCRAFLIAEAHAPVRRLDGVGALVLQFGCGHRSILHRRPGVVMAIVWFAFYVARNWLDG